MGEPRQVRELVQQDLVRMNIGRRYWGAKLDCVVGNLGELANKWADEYDEMMQKGVGFLFWGANGTSKTYTAAAMCKNVVRHRGSALMIVAAEFKDAAMKDGAIEGIGNVQQRARQVDFLVLDDLGKEYRANSGYAELQLENLIRYRNRELKTTVITTNMTLDEIKDVYKVSFLELVKESMVPVKVEGDSYRRKLQKSLVDKLLS